MGYGMPHPIGVIDFHTPLTPLSAVVHLSAPSRRHHCRVPNALWAPFRPPLYHCRPRIPPQSPHPPSVAPACGRPGVPSPLSRIPGRAEDSVSYAVGCVTYKPLPVRLPCHCEGIPPTPQRWGKSVGADEGVTVAQSRFSPAAIRTGTRGDVPQNSAIPDVEDVSAPIGLKLGRHSVSEVGSGRTYVRQPIDTVFSHP